MGFLGIGGLELLLILVVALFVIGPKRLVGFIRDFKNTYAELRRKRQELTSMVEEELELEEIRKEVDLEETTEGLKEVREALEMKDLQDAPISTTKRVKHRKM